MHTLTTGVRTPNPLDWTSLSASITFPAVSAKQTTMKVFFSTFPHRYLLVKKVNINDIVELLMLHRKHESSD